MLILGLAGGFDPVHESVFAFDQDFVHDAAAALVRDGEVIAGIEEERLNRIKHTNKFGTGAICSCLKKAGVELSDVDYIAIYASENFLTQSLRYLYLRRPEIGAWTDARGMCQALFQREFGFRPERDRFKFVHHHIAHVAMSYYLAGFRDSLVLSVDGAGDDISTMLVDARNTRFHVLMTKPINDSLGFFYLDVIRFLGYRIFDEYKVMGLAPYGRPETYRHLFQTFYTLLPKGDYIIHKDKLMGLCSILEPRRGGEPFNQVHKDIAAALQETLEAIVLHVLKHFQRVTGHEFLSLGGGVAQNSSMNGQILRSGLFKDVFATSFTADQGCAVGAALYAAHEVQPSLPLRRASHSFWGTDIGSRSSVRSELESWSALLDVRSLGDPYDEVAELIAAGAVVGWVQGRSEFGPRALGNRSILADPRIASHKDTINEMIKKRENYRPFAPSVLGERVRDFFEVPGLSDDFPFMAFVLAVREEMQQTLGAITHVDGTARLQTVSKVTNPRFWALIDAFCRKTGVPMLLNTSFNNNAEPIVNSVDDAVACYLTSGLNYLVVDDFIAEKKRWDGEALLGLAASCPKAARLMQEDRYISGQDRGTEYLLVWNYDTAMRYSLSQNVFDILHVSEGTKSVCQVSDDLGIAKNDRQEVASEIFRLWTKRLIILRPLRDTAQEEINEQNHL